MTSRLPTNKDMLDDLTELPLLPPGTILTTLENGLVLIVREDRSAPVVSAQAWCKAGSINEGKWLGAGLSHLPLVLQKAQPWGLPWG